MTNHFDSGYRRRGGWVGKLGAFGRGWVTLAIGGLLLGGGQGLEGQTFLVDFGADGTQTSRGEAPNDAVNYWNNVPNAVGTTVGGAVSNLVSVANEPSTIDLVILDRFNGANENGTTGSLLPYPGNATRDSLYGNTEVWNGVTDIYPKFKLAGLDPTATYTLTFYASRMGVSDNRETGYTITGAQTTVVALDAAANADGEVVATGVTPDAAGEITVRLAPTENNNNAYHFTYLGVLKIEALVPQTPIVFTEQPVSQTVEAYRPVTFRAAVSGSPPYQVQWYENGVAIPEATQMVYRIAQATPDLNGKQYTVTVSNLTYGATSAAAVLTVTPDGTAPGLVGVASLDGFSVQVQFDEGVEPGTAADPANYAVANPPATPFIQEAQLGADGRTVTLLLVERLLGNFTVTVSGVRDWAGNTIAANTSRSGVAPVVGPLSFLFDFGAGGTVTDHGPAPDDPVYYWNNVTATLGGTELGELYGLVTAHGEPTSASLVILSRFNGSNANGTTANPDFPVEATRDSLFGNTEVFSGLENIFPSFKLVGLDPAKAYDVLFFASRTGVSDNRETAYTLVGAGTTTVMLNAGNNVSATVTASGVKPDAAGELTISLAPGPNNNNGNHFTYLGVMKVSLMAPRMQVPVVSGNQVTLSWVGEGALEWAPAANGPWTAVSPAPTSPYTQALVTGQNRFYRIKQ